MKFIKENDIKVSYQERTGMGAKGTKGAKGAKGGSFGQKEHIPKFEEDTDDEEDNPEEKEEKKEDEKEDKKEDEKEEKKQKQKPQPKKHTENRTQNNPHNLEQNSSLSNIDHIYMYDRLGDDKIFWCILYYQFPHLQVYVSSIFRIHHKELPTLLYLTVLSEVVPKILALIYFSSQCHSFQIKAFFCLPTIKTHL